MTTRPRPTASPFAIVLEAARNDGRSARQLAKDSEIPQRTMVDWTKGKEPAAFAALQRLAGALGLEVIVRKR